MCQIHIFRLEFKVMSYRKPFLALFSIVRVMINALMVTMGCRDLKVAQFWRDQITAFDKLEITNYVFEEAHQIAKDYLLTHSEYSHLLLIAEDVLVLPDHIALLIKDFEHTGYPVICGYVNLNFSCDFMSLNTKDLRNIQIRHTRQYEFPTLTQILGGFYLYPFQKVFFQGKALMLVTREVVEKVSFKPYIRWFTPRNRRRFGNQNAKKGTMFDLQFAIDCANLEIPVVVDMRLMLFHFGDTDALINLSGKTRSVTLIKKDGSKTALRQDPPYF